MLSYQSPDFEDIRLHLSRSGSPAGWHWNIFISNCKKNGISNSKDLWNQKASPQITRIGRSAGGRVCHRSRIYSLSSRDSQIWSRRHGVLKSSAIGVFLKQSTDIAVIRTNRNKVSSQKVVEWGLRQNLFPDFLRNYEINWFFYLFIEYFKDNKIEPDKKIR